MSSDKADGMSKMVPIGAVSGLLITMMAARNELSWVTLKAFRVSAMAKIFKKMSPPLQEDGA